MNTIATLFFKPKNDGVLLPRRINSKNRLLFLYDSIPIDYENTVLECWLV